MNFDQTATIAILALTLIFFVWGRWRYDLVAFAALIVAVIVGVVDAETAFEGFGHAAVITVVAVLILTRALSDSGAIDWFTKRIMPSGDGLGIQLLFLCVSAAILSAFINNIGALALLMPVAIKTATDRGQSPAMLLMPLSFASILGGLATGIGTPPNIIIASYRADVLGEPFRMFDFGPVGALVAIAGVIFVVIAGWRLIPLERRSQKPTEDLIDIADYVAEARVPEDAAAIGMSVREVDEMAAAENADIVGLLRENERISLDRRRKLMAGDVLIFESSPDRISAASAAAGLELVAGDRSVTDDLRSDDIGMVEAVVGHRSMLEGKTVREFRLRHRYRVSLLAASRRGKSYKGRLRDFRFETGDVLLLLGDLDRLPSLLSTLGLLPLAERSLGLEGNRKALSAVLLFGAAIALAALGVLSAPVALGAAVIGMVVTGVIAPGDAYESVDWSVVVLLGSLIPFGGALTDTGLTALLAESFVAWSAGYAPWLILAAILIFTMTLSDVLNNTATTVVMAPIAFGIASELGINPDTFLMAVAVGASCAFLTPIGHKNNVLVMGPGGYRFGDYWRMGLPLEVLITAVAVPLLLVFWPL